jgi:PAS domain-containing protein
MSEKPTYEELLKRVLELEKAELERKQNSEALHRSQVMMARTERIANVGSWEWEIATDTVTWSDELFRIFQIDPDEKVPSWAEHSALYHPEDMESLRHAVEASVADGKPYELELRALRKDGEIRVCLARGFAETGPDGRATRLFGSLQDITDRKQAEEEIHNTHHRLSYALKLTTTIISAVPIPLFYKDREGRYIGVNDAFSELMGFTPDYYTGKTVMELWPSEFAEVYHRKDLELMRHPEKQVYDFEVLDKQNSASSDLV